MTVALGIAPDSSGTGVDPLTHRKLIMGHWNNVGIISNSRSKADEMPLNVTGRSDLRYDVAAGAAVCSRGRADGYTEAYWAGGQSPAIPTPDPNNGRCDYVWIRANDPTQGGSSNQVEIGVTAGTPAANPGYPTWPSDATVIAMVSVPAGATSTKQCEILRGNWALAAGGNLSRIAVDVNNYEGPGDYGDGGKDYFEQEMSFTLPSDRIIEFRYTATACCADPNDPSKPSYDASRFACWYVGVQLDGVDIPNGGGQFQVSRAWQQVHLNVVHTVSAGTHTVRTRNHRVTWGENVYFVAHTDEKETYPGRTLEVWDRGPVADADNM